MRDILDKDEEFYLDRDELINLASYISQALQFIQFDGYDSDTAEVVSETIHLIPLSLFNIEDVEFYHFGITDPIGQIAEWIYERLSELASWFAGSVSAIIAPLKSAVDSISNFIITIPDRIKSAIEALFSQVWNILTMISGALTEISSRIWEGIQSTISFISENVYGFLQTIWSGLQEIGIAIGDFFGRMWEGLQTIGGTIIYGVSSLAENLAKFSDYVYKFGAQVLGGLSDIGAFITGFIDWIKTLPDMVAKIFIDVTEFFKNLRESFAQFVSDPTGFIREKIIAPFWNGTLWITTQARTAFVAFLSMATDAIKAGGSIILETFRSIGSWILEGMANLTSLISSSLMEISQKFIHVGLTQVSFVLRQFIGMTERIDEVIPILNSVIVRPALSDIEPLKIPGLTIKNFLETWKIAYSQSILLFMVPLVASLLFRALGYQIKGLGLALTHEKIEKEISLAPFGIGGTIRFDVMKWLGGAIANFGDEFMKFGDKYYDSMWTGLGIWFARYVSIIFAFYLRNFIPIEFPTIREVEEAWIRARVADKIPPQLGMKGEIIQRVMRYYLEMKGYADYLLNYQFASPDEFFCELVDRFEIKRKFPLGGVWRLPSVYDIAQMWVRDVLRPPKLAVKDILSNLTKAYESIGVYKDIGLLYTLLAFKYPSPDALAEFYWRGIAKTLWLEDTLEEPEWKELFNITWKATAPYTINKIEKRAELLSTMISQYMKWHDLFPAPWSPEFPTDKSIIVELMADLPTRIDLRWLSRWGIFEHLSLANVSPMADLKEIYEAFVRLKGDETRQDKVSPEISMDVRFLARFLIATRMNPLIVPLVSVAQMHAILTGEMTLLRSGFIDSLRRGFITLDLSEQLMSGLLKITFKTGYIDTKTGKFHEIIYPKPVFWLSAERRLLQMRAMFDRYNWIMRDIVSRCIYGLMWVAITPDEAKSMIVDFQEVISEHIKDQIKTITGFEWKPKLDESYMNVWIEYGKKVRVIGTRTWIRRYLSRMLGWMFYRVIYGWVDPKDLENLIHKISQVGKISILEDEEIEYLKTVANEISGLVKKELIPTPSTLATFSEYMIIDSSIIDAVLEHYKVPKEYINLYKNYIMIRPLKSDFRSLLTKARSAYVRGAISENEWNKYLDKAKKYGFKDEEISLIGELAELEEKITSIKEWTPTITSLITISEVVPEAIELLKLYPIKEEFKLIINAYAIRKPLADEIRSLLNQYYRARRYAALHGQTIPKEMEDLVRDFMKLGGISDIEESIRDLATRFEILVDTWKEYLPTLSVLAAMAEYIDIPSDYIQKVITLKRVEVTLSQLWMEYMQTRTIATEVGRVVSAFTGLYTRYSVPEELVTIVKELMMRGGWTSSELPIFELELFIRRYYRTLTLLIPTVRGFITDAQYLPNYQKLLEDLFKTYGLTLEQYKAQAEYYKMLAKNRRLWRHFSWYRSQLAYAYQYGAITKDKAKQLLQKFVDAGLLDSDELDMILEGLDLRAAGYRGYQATFIVR